jgi:adenylate cyclase
MNRGFWDGVAERLRPIGVIGTVENPRIVVRIFMATLVFSVTSALVQAALFLWFDEPAAGFSSLLLAAGYVVAMLWFLTTGGVLGVMVIGLTASAADVVFVQFAMGGFAYSGDTMAWSIAIVLTAALVFSARTTAVLGAVFAAITIAFGFMEESLQSSRPAPDPTLTSVLFVAVLVGILGLLLLVFMTLLARLIHERRRAEGLLLNVLPAEVAAELKRKGETVARHYDGISVLFADIVGFTPLSVSMEPEEMVGQLNDVFTYFDGLADRYGVEKIRTIGDNYMAAAGVPTPRDDHAEALCAMAVDMMRYAETGPLSFRIGINSGPAVAGVIGTKKFQYDVWGDTVNTASRMESQGEPGRIQITETTRRLIEDTLPTIRRGPVDIKGKGTLTTYWLESPAGATP